MTTIGVKPAPSERVMDMSMPNYSYMYPNTRSVQLSAVKEGIYHPNLPTFRRMDMDTAAHRLPDEHCRQTTSAPPGASFSRYPPIPDVHGHMYENFPPIPPPEDFRKTGVSLFTPPTKSLNTAGITEMGRQLTQHYGQKHELRDARLDWSDFLNKCPERYNIRLGKEPGRDLHFSGYAVRYLRPEITNSWRYKLRQEPGLDVNGQRPTPATSMSRHRGTAASYSRNISSGPWK